jgi:hypothetical protein
VCFAPNLLGDSENYVMANAMQTANAHAALTAGATHVDTSVLGIGERNGITVSPKLLLL